MRETDAWGAHQDVGRTRIRLERAFSAKSSGAHKTRLYLFYREGQTIRLRVVGQFEFCPLVSRSRKFKLTHYRFRDREKGDVKQLM